MEGKGAGRRGRVDKGVEHTMRGPAKEGLLCLGVGSVLGLWRMTSALLQDGRADGVPGKAAFTSSTARPRGRG